jgi:predicted Zn-dependent peptidase
VKILKESPVEIFYVGSADPMEVAAVLTPIFEKLDRSPVSFAAQTPFRDEGPSHRRERQQITQSRLCLGYVTPITNRQPEFAAMQVMNTLFGAGMTSKLFQNIREKMSLCYSIGSGYYGAKGILTVSAGIDGDKEEVVRREVEAQLDDCRQGRITEGELEAAKAAVLSSLRAVMDSPGAIEGYFSVSALSGLCFTLPQYREAVEKITAEDVSEAAKSLQYHSSFFLEGVSQ